MATYSKYPNQIDTTTELPLATDLVTPVKAEVVNRLQDAIIAIETELGVQPSSTYGSVKNRLDIIEAGGGGGGGSGLPTKIRIFVDTPNQVGAVLGTPKLVAWNGISSLITATNAIITGSNNLIEITLPTIIEVYDVNGQLTLAPTAGSVNGIIIEIIKNTTVVHTVSDFGAVWGVGVNRSLGFCFKIELSGLDTISVQWTHSGNVGSTTETIHGDNLSWLSVVKIN